jgi:hypothetical protein
MDSPAYSMFFRSCLSINSQATLDSPLTITFLDQISRIRESNVTICEGVNRSAVDRVFSDKSVSLRNLCLIPYAHIRTEDRKVRKSILHGEILVAETEESSPPTHKIEISNIVGHNFPSLNFLGIGKASSCVVVKLSNMAAIFETETQTGGDPSWKSTFSYNTVGFLHKKIIFEIYYTGFLQRKLIGTVTYPLLGVDTSKSDSCIIDTSCCPEIDKKLGDNKGSLRPVLELSVRIQEL